MIPLSHGAPRPTALSTVGAALPSDRVTGASRGFWGRSSTGGTWVSQLRDE